MLRRRHLAEAAVAPGDRPVGPDWSTRIRRAIIGIGLVWIFVGAGVTDVLHGHRSERRHPYQRCPHQ